MRAESVLCYRRRGPAGLPALPGALYRCLIYPGVAGFFARPDVSIISFSTRTRFRQFPGLLSRLGIQRQHGVGTVSMAVPSARVFWSLPCRRPRRRSGSTSTGQPMEAPASMRFRPMVSKYLRTTTIITKRKIFHDRKYK